MRFCKLSSMFLVVALVCCAVVAQADVFNMGTGLTSLEMVPVGNPGNAPDTRYQSPGYGAVTYQYSIGKFEVTAAQYTEFLNAVAKTADPYGLYNWCMGAITGGTSTGCMIHQNGTPGNYTYNVSSDFANRPVNYVSWGDAARFSNWLANGQPSPGAEDLSTTEDGSYYLNGATTNTDLMAITRKANTRYVIPSTNEWYKAAYHKNDGITSNYWDFPTGTNTIPSNVFSSTGTNNANFVNGVVYSVGDPYYRNEVGAFTNSVSPYGTFDQGGNVMEWNETAVTSEWRGVRGGEYHDYYGFLAASSPDHYIPTMGDEYGVGAYIGFRVASVPEPGSLVMLAGIALTALLYWGRKRA